jgi:hypothetical protein
MRRSTPIAAITAEPTGEAAASVEGLSVYA